MRRGRDGGRILRGGKGRGEGCGEKDGPAVDDDGALKSTGPVARETNGLLASSARLDGSTPAKGVT